MGEAEYLFLDALKIENCDLIKKNYSVISNFCLRNKIETLGNLVRKYEKGEVNLKNKKSVEEMDGFIDLIKYLYFQIRLPKENLLFDEIIIIHDTWHGRPWKGRHEVGFNTKKIYNPLKRLGFNSDETDSILSFVSHKKKDMMIISALMNYKEEAYYRFAYSSTSNRVSIDKKIDLFIEYYNKYLKVEQYAEFYKTVELDDLLKEFKDKKEEIIRLANEIKALKTKINSKSQFVPIEKSQRLMKQYNYNQ